MFKVREWLRKPQFIILSSMRKNNDKFITVTAVRISDNRKFTTSVLLGKMCWENNMRSYLYNHTININIPLNGKINKK